MRQFGAVFALAVGALVVETGMVLGQDAAPTAAATFETEQFSGSELLAGKKMTEAQCAALPGAVWVVVDRRGDCIRYYHSTAGGGGG